MEEEKSSNINEVSNAAKVEKVSCVRYFDALWFCYCTYSLNERYEISFSLMLFCAFSVRFGRSINHSNVLTKCNLCTMQLQFTSYSDIMYMETSMIVLVTGAI